MDDSCIGCDYVGDRKHCQSCKQNYADWYTRDGVPYYRLEE